MIQDYQKVITIATEVSHAISKDLNNPKATDHILSIYKNQLNSDFIQSLKTIKDFLEKKDLPLSYQNTSLIYMFGFEMQDWEGGNSEVNLGIAIACWELLSLPKSYSMYPILWPTIQLSLGKAYYRRYEKGWGNSEENQELAIKSYQLAATALLKDNSQFDELNLSVDGLETMKLVEKIPDRDRLIWAETQQKLGLAYYHRICGNKAKNEELAIIALTRALHIYTPESTPEDWAYTKMMLAIVYSNRCQGMKKNNLERAMEYLQKALSVVSQEEFPNLWAEIQNHLGNILGQQLIRI